MKATGFLILCLGLALTVWSPEPAGAVNPDEMLEDPKMETRAREISKELRCLVCQNQSIDDSDAPLAKDLRVLVRDRLKAGDSDEQVINFVVDRYGDFVLLRPPVKGATLVLWGGPALIVLFGIAAVVIFLRRNRKPADLEALAAQHGQEAGDGETGITRGLSPSERQRIERILNGGQR